MVSTLLDTAADVLRDRQRILVFTGAGISTGSGIPDFRGPNGVWTRVDPDEFTYDKYVANPETRRKMWQMRYASPIFEAAPNAAHRAIASLWETGRMVGCVTQNIDGLHQAGGLPRGAVVELHGTVHEVKCLACGHRIGHRAVRVRLEAGEEDPECLECGGILKSATISFGEAMPQAEMETATDWALQADAVLAVGSTLSVYPAAFIPLEVVERGQPMILVNRGPTDHDRAATVKLDGDAVLLLPQLIDAIV